MGAPIFRDTRAAGGTDPDQLREDTRDLARQLTALATAKSIGIKTIGIVETEVPHNLGHRPEGWFPYRLKGLVMIGETKDPDAKNLYLIASTEVDVGLAVF